MNRLKLLLLSSTAFLVPVASLASPTIYIPLGSANEIMIVDGATDKEIGKITGFKNVHGLSLTPNGEYLVAGSNDEMINGKAKKSVHGKKPAKEDKHKTPAPVMAKPKGMSEAEHKSHHAAPAPKPESKGHTDSKADEHSDMKGAKNAGMKRPKGVSEAEHKKHHAASSGGLLPAVGTSSVSFIRVADNTIESSTPVRGAAHHTFVAPDGKYSVSTHTSAGVISLIDLATKKIFRNIYTGPKPNYVAFTQDGENMYVSNAGNNTLSVIDTKNWIVSQNIIVGKGPEHIVMSPDEKFVYTNNGRDGTVSKVSLAKRKVVKTFTIGNNPHGIDISADGKTLYATAKKGNKLVALNIATGKVRTLKLSPAPYHLTVISETGKIYVSSRKKPLIWVVDEKTLKVTNKIKVRGEGHQIVVVD